MKSLAFLLIIISLSFSVSCSKGEAEAEEVVIADDTTIKPDSKEEIVIDDRAFSGADSANNPLVATQERTKLAADGSKLTTMYDGFGNKTETRFFDNNPLLQNIIVRTSVKGEKQVLVFAQNGTVKTMPADMAGKFLIAPANELATAAGIYEGRKPQAAVDSQLSKPLTPLPSSAFPVRTPLPVPTVTPENIQPTPAETPPATDNSPVPKKKGENPELTSI